MAQTKNTYPNTEKVMEDWGATIVDEIVALLARRRKNASGILSNSIDYEVVTDDKGMELNITYARHGEFVLSGRRRGAKQPPVDPIIQWIRNKKIPVTTSAGKPTGQTKKLTKYGEEKSLAYKIAKSIARDGIQPFNFLRPFEQEVSGKEMQKDIRYALVKDGTANLQKATVEFNKKTK